MEEEKVKKKATRKKKTTGVKKTATKKKATTKKKTTSKTSAKKTSTTKKAPVKKKIVKKIDTEPLQVFNFKKKEEPLKVEVKEIKVVKKNNKKSKNNNYLYLILSILALILLVFVYKSLYGSDKNKLKTNIGNIDLTYEEATVENHRLSLVMVGDCLIHGAIYDDAKRVNNGKYDFHYLVENYKDIISKYDLAFYNQESLLGGTELGLSSYPRFNSPKEVGDAFLDLGFNLVSLANNHTLDKGERGILSSIDYWKSQKGIMTAGSYSSFEDRDKDVIMEKNGITYALLSYTTTTNGLPVPSGKEYLVNVYSDEKAKKDIERLRGKVDLLMVAMHWGEEYTHTPTIEQERIAKYLASLNVDIVIGHHPHVIQPVDFIGKTMVIYSLGNFVASQYGVEKLTGLVMSVEVNKKIENGVSTITLTNPTAELSYVYSVKDSYRHSYKMYPYEMLNDKLLKGYKEYYYRFMEIITRKYKNIFYKTI